MTGPFVPVGILNPIRAVVGIPHHRFNLFVKCSSPEVQKQARFVTASYKDEGFAKAVERYVLGRQIETLARK